MLPPQLFVTGIDTDAGKTVVSALLTLGCQADYWKPVQAGLEPSTDTGWVQKVTGLPGDHFHPEAYALRWPASPHAAAAREGVEIGATPPPFPPTQRPLIVEGAGGLMVPLSDSTLLIDWLAHWRIPVLLVVKTYLGCINHSLLSLEALRSRDIPLFGLVFNEGGRPESIPAIEQAAAAPTLARLPELTDLSPSGLKSAFQQYFKW